MKNKLILFLLLISSFTYPQIDKKFMELRGIEDSLGNTHLYYRMSYYIEIGIGTYYYYYNIYHINTANQTDVFFLSDYQSGFSSGQGIMVTGYEFWNNDPTKYIYCGSEGPLGLGGWGYIKRYSGNCQVPSSMRISGIQISAIDTKKLFCASTPQNISYISIDSGLTWSSLAPQNHMAVWLNPKNDELYARGNSQLKKSTDNGNTYVVSDEVYDYTYSFSNDKDSNYIYRLAQSGDYVFLASDSNGTEGSWVQHYASSNKLFYSVDTSNSGHIYLADGKKIFRSTDYGHTFNQVKIMNDNLLGIYKKPSSNLLYVLDLYNLYELNDTVLTTIKSLNPSDANEELNPITDYRLYQNYPNPFNPSTSIQYAISSRQFVQLKVYDVLGNEITTLVNEEKPEGMYNVQFTMNNLPAGRQGLSSGIYFYQLKAGNYLETKKMILMK